jgi:hypothetical protein
LKSKTGKMSQTKVRTSQWPTSAARNLKKADPLFLQLLFFSATQVPLNLEDFLPFLL